MEKHKQEKLETYRKQTALAGLAQQTECWPSD